MKKIAILILILTLTLSIFAGHNVQITGYVKSVKMPVKGFELILIEKKITVKTDEYGYYFFTNLDDGIYSLICGKKENNPILVENIHVFKDSTVIIDFDLSLKKAFIRDKSRISEKKSKTRYDAIVAVEDDEMEETMSFEISGMNFAPAMSKTRSAMDGLGGTFLAEEKLEHNTEEYSSITVNNFKKVKDTPVSTFSIDVDAASYANMRRFINSNQMPYKDAIRIEEMINYFNYDYKYPEGDVPFAVNTEISECPWNNKNKLVHIGLQGQKMEQGSDVKSNFVFLLDVSGSMNSTNKLGLLKKSFSLLLDALKPTDRVAIAVYAGNAGLVLPSTEVNEKKTILDALEKLKAGGSTAGGAGIKLAYKIAEENLIKDGNNRIILATDGDFNVGVSSTSELVKMMEEKRNKGIFLTILGFGMGNYKDGRMEEIADKGNGNYFYIDNILEAKKVLVTELAGTMYTIAKDVKIQIEFNPVKVESYRLIGYENRLLNKEDFDDDKKDAGELGAGHTVTALYEIVPGNGQTSEKVDDMKYQQLDTKPYAYKTNELMFVKLRYKEPKEDVSKLIEHPLKDEGISLKKSSNNFRFSAAVAEYGMLLRESEFKGDSSFDKVLEMAKSSKGDDDFGYRAEFIQLVEKAKLLKK